MNTNDPWQRLADSVRRRTETPPISPAEMPFGFEARVLARVRAPRVAAIELWARLAFRALPLGAAALVLCWVSLPAQPTAEPAADVVEQLMQEVLNP